MGYEIKKSSRYESRARGFIPGCHTNKTCLGPVYIEWGPQSIGAGFFCFHALEDTKQKKLTPLDRGPPLHVNRVLIIKFKTN